MKKKKLAAASLLLALLMPLGTTPMAAYADEVDAQVETSTVEEAAEETAETNEDTGSEVDTLEAKEGTAAPVALDAADTGLDDVKTFSPNDGDILNKRTGEVYAYADFERP